MISAQHIDKSFGRLQVLNKVSYEFKRGQVYTLIGPNASGKTTLIKCILGLVKPDGGQITVDGENVNGLSAYRSKIGYMPQLSSFPDTMTVKQVIDMIVYIRNAGTAINREMIEIYGLADFYQKRMDTLSGGTRQKVNAAIAFLFDTAVLILDEPTAGLDPLSAATLKERILRERKAGKLVLITTHNIADIDELSDTVLYLESGCIQFAKSAQDLRDVSDNHSTGKGIQHFIRHHEAI